MRNALWAIGLGLCVACGGGGGGGGEGRLIVANQGQFSQFGGCGVDVQITRVGDDEPVFVNLQPCETQSFDLDPGSYNVEGVALGGACSLGGALRETVEIRDGENTPFWFQCGSCTVCDGAGA